jgi:hypothetical protein
VDSLAVAARSKSLAARQLESHVIARAAAVKLDEIVANSAALGDDGLLPEHLKKDSIGLRVAIDLQRRIDGRG